MVKTGLHLLVTEQAALVHAQRVGLVTHPAAVLPDLTGALPALQQAGVQVTALFGPEHGFTGAAADGAQVDHATDAQSGLPVFSLYGATQEPTPKMLAGVDVLVFDMQDVGVRFYTYLSTLYYVLRGAAKAGVPVIILDRPNPLGGEIIEGPSISPGYTSFVGIVPLPIRHGMTLGELGRCLNTEEKINARLTVIPMTGWSRQQWFDQTDLPWVPTSPAMPHFSTATLYPGMCLIEGTNLSEGRGTALPFELCGAPWIDGFALAGYLNDLQIPGARFRPAQFTPSASKHAGQVCSGVQVHVTNRQALRPVHLGVQVLMAVRKLYPQKFSCTTGLDRLYGSNELRRALTERTPDELPTSRLFAGWEAAEQAFHQRRAPYLLYS